MLSKIKVGSIMLLIVFILSSSVASAKEIELTIAHGIGAADHDVIKALFDQFNKEYEGKIKVTELLMGWDDVYQKVAQGRIMGSAPDMTIVHTSNMIRFVNEQLIIPLDDLFKKYDIKSSDFNPGIFDGIKVGGKIYAMPWDTHTMVIWYNRDHFAEVGLNPKILEERPISYSETINFARKLLKKDSAGNVIRWGFGNFPDEHVIFWSFLWQFGGEMFDKELTRCTANSEAGVKAMQSLYDLIFKYKVASASGGAFDAFRAGKLSMFMSGSWWLMGLKAQEGLNFGLGLFPTWGQKRAVRIDTHTFAIVNQPQPQERLDACMTFFKWMTAHNAIWATAGHIPANKKAAESDIFKSVYEMNVAKKQLPWARYPDRTIVDPQMWEFTAQEMGAALSGQKTPKQAVDDLATRLTRALQEAKAK